MPHLRRRLMVCTTLFVGVLAAGCGHDDSTSAAGTPISAPDSSTAPAGAGSTPQLDSIVVLGHSGTTGYNSDPSQPGIDARENSWATGTNPEVDSIYQHLLATHPALKGHTSSLGVDGSTVDELAAQVDSMLSLDPLPDVVIIQTIDNDIRCDGTDARNVTTFGKTLDATLTTVGREDPHAQVFLVSQWGSVRHYVNAVKGLPASVTEAQGNGPCDTFTFGGKVRPAGVASLQRLVDLYFATVQHVCDSHPRCWTDRGALQTMPVRRSYLTDDSDHLSVAGQAVMARYAWRALPAAIKNRS